MATLETDLERDNIESLEYDNPPHVYVRCPEAEGSDGVLVFVCECDPEKHAGPV